MRMPALPFLAAAVLGVAAAFLVACGDRNGLIPPGAAHRLNADLSAVSSAVNARNCQAADTASSRVRGDILNTPSSVDQALVNRLSNGVDNLRRRAQAQCSETQQQSTPVQTSTETNTTQTNTTPTNTTPTSTTPTTPTSTTTTPTSTTPTATTPTTTTPPSTSPTGGAGADAGGNGTGGTG